MTKILINCLALSQSSGGYRSYCANLIYRLVNKAIGKDFEIKILISPNCLSYFENKISDDNFIYVNQKLIGFHRIIWEMRNIPSICAKNKINIIYTPYQIGPIRINNVKSILMFRNMEPYVASKYNYPIKNRIRNILLNRLAKYYLNKADSVIAVSDFTKQFLINNIGIKEKKINVIYHGFNKSKTTFLLNEYGKYFFTAGSMNPYRRIEDVIEAFNLYNEMEPSTVKLIIAGNSKDDRYKRKINTLINNSKFRKKILNLGYVSKAKMEALYNNALVFIMSSEIEACPNIAIESMSFGCPIISSTNPPMPEFFGDAAKYYGYRDTNKLAIELKELEKNAHIRWDLSKKAIKRSQKYSWEKTANETYKLFQSL